MHVCSISLAALQDADVAQSACLGQRGSADCAASVRSVRSMCCRAIPRRAPALRIPRRRSRGSPVAALRPAARIHRRCAGRRWRDDNPSRQRRPARGVKARSRANPATGRTVRSPLSRSRRWRPLRSDVWDCLASWSLVADGMIPAACARPAKAWWRAIRNVAMSSSQRSNGGESI